MTQITEQSTKADIIDAAIEFTDSQAELINELQQRQTFLIKVVAVLLLITVLF